ncbi:MAG TPA: hypothetical protein VNE18_10315 [Rhodanobacter sp.]|nr:hypothetical protein [Rhodanobacter sp.]
MHHAQAEAAPTLGLIARQEAAADAINGLNEPLWQAVYHQVARVPSYADALEVVMAMPDAELALFL